MHAKNPPKQTPTVVGNDKIYNYVFFLLHKNWILLSHLHNYIKNELLKDEARSVPLIMTASSHKVSKPHNYDTHAKNPHDQTPIVAGNRSGSRSVAVI